MIERIATASTSAATSTTATTTLNSLVSFPIAGLGALIAPAVGILPLLGNHEDKHAPAIAARAVEGERLAPYKLGWSRAHREQNLLPR